MLRTRTDAKALFRETGTTGKEAHPEYQYYEYQSDWQRWLSQYALTQVA